MAVLEDGKGGLPQGKRVDFMMQYIPNLSAWFEYCLSTALVLNSKPVKKGNGSEIVPFGGGYGIVAFRSAKERLVNALLRSKRRRCFAPREKNHSLPER